MLTNLVDGGSAAGPERIERARRTVMNAVFRGTNVYTQQPWTLRGLLANSNMRTCLVDLCAKTGAAEGALAGIALAPAEPDAGWVALADLVAPGWSDRKRK
jgi:hypothetical protein